jgi:hypothetical protein
MVDNILIYGYVIVVVLITGMAMTVLNGEM